MNEFSIASYLLNLLLLIVLWRYIKRSTKYRKSLQNVRTDKSYLSMALHEVRNLANAIAFQVEALNMYLGKKSPETDMSPLDYANDNAQISLDDIYSSSRALHNFIYEFFESRKKSTSRTITVKTTNISNAVRDTFKIFKGSISEKRELRVLSEYLQDSAGQDIKMQTDPVKVKQILLNLVGNSIKYTNSGKVTVNVFEIEKDVVIEVRDTGIGIPKKELKKISDMYFRASNSSEKDGIGIGLHIVHTLVDILKGSISIISKEGEGTTVTVTLPKENDAKKVL
jgi:two-component system phosphate regulon sensor histidine kinase PhoR